MACFDGATPTVVIPAKAGTQTRCSKFGDAVTLKSLSNMHLRMFDWVPAFAGMTEVDVRLRDLGE